MLPCGLRAFLLPTVCSARGVRHILSVVSFRSYEETGQQEINDGVLLMEDFLPTFQRLHYRGIACVWGDAG